MYIKFRVRERDTNKFVGYECLMPDITNDQWMWAKSYGGKDWENGTYDQGYYIRDQYTGMNDKNGAEIFNRDTLEGFEGKGVYVRRGNVYFDQGRFMVKLKGVPRHLRNLAPVFEIKKAN